ncbi:MAG: TolC family protein [Spirochaetes bacterium]|nr:TolC family protein [Spirochaetota bacterium]
MKTGRSNGIIAALAASVIFFSMATPARAGENVLSLREFLEKAALSNPDIFAQLDRLGESEALEQQGRAVYDIVFNLHYSRLYDRPFSEYSSVKIREQTTDGAGASLLWTMPHTGTRLRGGFDYVRNRITLDAPSPVPPFAMERITADLYNPDIFIEVQQPLLRNWLGVIDSFPLRQSRLNRRIMRETVDESIEAIMADLYNLYFSWYLAHNQLQIYEKNLANSEILLRQVAQRHRTGLTDLSDLSKTRIMNIEYTKARDLQRARFENLGLKIARWYSGEEGIAAPPRHVPEKELPVPTAPEAAFDIGSTRQMRILELSRRLLMEKLEREQSELLPDLSAVFSYRFRNYDLNREESIESFNYNTYSAGLSFTYPLGNSLAGGRVEETRAAIRKWGHDAAAFERNLAQGYSETRRMIRTYGSLLEQDDALLKNALLQLEAEDRKYRQGRTDLFFVIQARNSLLNYELLRITDYTHMKSLEVQILGLMDRIRKR